MVQIKKGKKRIIKEKKIKSKNSVNEIEDEGMKKFMNVMSKLDNKKVPLQEKIDESSGQTLKKYLVKFESYCKSNFKGNQDFQIGELDRHLTWKTWDAFRAVRDVDDNYENLKRKLLEWYGEWRSRRIEKEEEQTEI